MKKKFEPLKGKIISEKEENFFREQDIKSAVQGLLEEIRIEKERYEENKQVVAGLCIAEELIKKWFADVVSEDE